MAERPILFSGAMVRAILEGRKSQTRRVVKGRGSRGLPEFHGGRGEENDPSAWGWFFDGPDHHGYEVLARGLDERHDHGLVSMPCPYGEPGDRLWVRETWAHDGSKAPPLYRASWQCKRDYPGVPCEHGPDRWRPPIYMPRWASRLTLEVTGVRVERLNDISEEDAKAEGVERFDTGWRDYSSERPGEPTGACFAEARDSFRTLWESINGPDSWAANPWVWVVEFKRVTP